MLETDELQQALRQVIDPELGLNIVELGLVYGVDAQEGDVEVRMTLTSPGCPAGPQIMDDVQRTLKMLDGVTSVNVELVWEPYWTPERIDPKVRAVLGL
jgi:metal-sulfur cluster biosynthetic enzyme